MLVEREEKIARSLKFEHWKGPGKLLLHPLDQLKRVQCVPVLGS